MKINLIPKKETKTNIWPIIARPFKVSLITIFLVMLIIASRYVFNKVEYNRLSSEEKSLVESGDSLREFKESYGKFQNHPAIPIIYNHVYFSQFFQKIDNAKSDLEFEITSIATDDLYSVDLQGKTRSYVEISRFSKALKKNGFSEVGLVSVNADFNKDLTFAIKFKFPKEFILK